MSHSHSPHSHGHSHDHDHDHEQRHEHRHGSLLVLRPSTGIAGDIMVAGLAGLLGIGQDGLDALIAAIGMPELAPGSFRVREHSVNAIGGLQGVVTLPHEHAHRSFSDIRALIDAGTLEERAKSLALEAFRHIAEAEAAVHGKTVDDVAFHEIGALDSILDICLASALFARLAPDHFICGPLPLCDGVIHCAHGAIPAPAPAVLRMLHGVAVQGFTGTGETVTPTGLGLLKAFGASFGPWPAMTLAREVIAYGSKVFPGVPNGALFAVGDAYADK